MLLTMLSIFFDLKKTCIFLGLNAKSPEKGQSWSSRPRPFQVSTRLSGGITVATQPATHVLVCQALCLADAQCQFFVFDAVEKGRRGLYGISDGTYNLIFGKAFLRFWNEGFRSVFLKKRLL